MDIHLRKFSYLRQMIDYSKVINKQGYICGKIAI